MYQIDDSDDIEIILKKKYCSGLEFLILFFKDTSLIIWQKISNFWFS